MSSQLLLKPDQLAKCLDVNCGHISMAVKRNSLDKDENGFIDILTKKNAFWIDTQTRIKGKTFDLKRINIDESYVDITPINRMPKKSVEKEPKKKQIETSSKKKSEKEIIKNDGNDYDSTDNDSNDNEYDSGVLLQQKLKMEIIRLKNSDTKDKLQIAKLQGDLLPTLAVENIFLWSAQNFRKTFEQDIDSLINIFIKRLGGSQNDFIDMKKEAMKKLAMSGSTLIENLTEGLATAISEYKDVRGRGERK
jgi:hypothetical protein